MPFKFVRQAISFFAFHFKLLKELFAEFNFRTLIVLMLSLILPLSGLAEVKLLEFLTNSVAEMGLDNGSFSLVVVTVCELLFIILVSKAVGWLFDIVNNRYCKQIVVSKQKKLLRKLDRISYECYESAAFYNDIWLAYRAPSEYASAISQITALINVFVYLIIYSVMLCQINLFFVLFLAATFLLNVYLSKKTTNKWDYIYDEQIIPEQRRSNYFETVLSNRVNHHTIQTGRQLPYFSNKYEEHADNERKSTLKLNALTFITELSVSIFFIITAFAILLYVANGIAAGRYMIGKFTLICAVMFQLFDIFRSLTQYIFADKRHMKIIQTYERVFDFPDRVQALVSAGDGVIKLSDLNYRYAQADADVLHHISFTFKKGEKIAIVGANGSGKTTLVSIILNLLECGAEEFHNGIGQAIAVMQDFQSYQMTIRENIQLGISGKTLSKQKIDEILKKVGLLDVVERLPNGIDTYIGELNGGVEMSKGQLQRLAIARMLANEEAKVWILDEPTAFLDPIAEIDMYDYILSLAGDRLVFFISHRLGFARKADRIIVIDNGAICEYGSHDELMQKDGGLYKRMFDAQKTWYSNE